MTGTVDVSPARRLALPPDSSPISVTTAPDAARWDAFLESHSAATVEHLWAWRDIFSDVFGQEPVYLAARRGQDIVGVLPLVKMKSLLFGRSLVSLPYANYAGVIASEAAAARALVARARAIGEEFGASHVELRNVDRQLHDLPCREHKVGGRLTLPPTTEALWTSIDRKVRNQVRKAQKEGLTTEIGDQSLVSDFYGVFARNMRDLGTPVFPRMLFVEVLRRFSRQARVIVIRHDGTPIAGAIALTWRGTMLVPWASSLRAHRHLCANMLMYWSMLEQAVSSGCRIFDFGRSTPGGGTHQFKQQWGAQDVPLHWEYVLARRTTTPDQGTSNNRLRPFIMTWQRLPLGIANWLGPRLIRHVS